MSERGGGNFEIPKAHVKKGVSEGHLRQVVETKKYFYGPQQAGNETTCVGKQTDPNLSILSQGGVQHRKMRGDMPKEGYHRYIPPKRGMIMFLILQNKFMGALIHMLKAKQTLS